MPGPGSRNLFGKFFFYEPVFFCENNCAKDILAIMEKKIFFWGGEVLAPLYRCK
jgi:hypothetical protein